MFCSLSLFPFTLLNFGWITNTTRAVANSKETATYDFIVIGGGNSYAYLVFASEFTFFFDWRIIRRGLAIASRLSEDPSITVAVLEAGPNVEHLPEVRSPPFPPAYPLTQNNQVFIPGLIGTGESFTTLNWAYQTTKQEHLGNRQLTVGAGKALGGGTISTSSRTC